MNRLKFDMRKEPEGQALDSSPGFLFLHSPFSFSFCCSSLPSLFRLLHFHFHPIIFRFISVLPRMPRPLSQFLCLVSLVIFRLIRQLILLESDLIALLKRLIAEKRETVEFFNVLSRSDINSDR